MLKGSVAWRVIPGAASDCLVPLLTHSVTHRTTGQQVSPVQLLLQQLRLVQGSPEGLQQGTGGLAGTWLTSLMQGNNHHLLMPLPVPSKKCSVADSILRPDLLCHAVRLLVTQLLMAMLWDDRSQIEWLTTGAFSSLLLPAARCMRPWGLLLLL